MQKQEKSRKPLIIGIIAAVVILAALLALLLTQCVGGQGNGDSTPTTTVATDEVPTYELYWNVDRAEYDGKSEAGMSSRMPEDDGYFHVRFFTEGETVTLKVADRKLINAIDVQSLMGLEFDDNGIVIGVLKLEEMPLEKVGWQFYVQSAARTMIKLNSSEGLNGMEVLLEDLDPNRVWDMTGKSGPVGSVSEAITYDKIMAVQNEAGQVTHVFIFERPNWMMTHKAYCEHCKEEVDWQEWIKTEQVPMVTGHYQLQNDITLKVGQQTPAEDTKLCIDLNGYTINGKSGSRVYAIRNVGNTIAIMDTSEKQNGAIATHGKHDQGGPIWLTKGALYLYGGALDASDATSEKSGVALSISNGAFFYMYGGSVIGGTATYTYNAETNKYGGGLGGAITCSGKFVMNGGVIEGGHAEAAIVYKDGKVDSYQRGYGGSLYVSSTGVFEMNGGTIKNGRAGSAGGNIYADGKAEITMNGGSIEGGVVYGKGKNGGSISLGSKTTFTMNGGSITGGTSYNAAGNIYTNGTMVMTGGYIGGGICRNFTTGKISTTSASTNLFNVNGNVTMWGGTIAGGVSVTDTSATNSTVATLALYGYARITDGPYKLDLSISNNENKIIVGTLYDGAKIGVNTTKGLFSEITSKDNLDNFYSNIEGAEIVYFEERLGLGRAACICGKSHGETVSEAHNVGCEGKQLFWVPWTSTSSLPTTTGNYFLLKNVTTTKQTTILEADQDIKLDLNGKKVTLKVPASTYDGFRLYRCDQNSKLAITDTTDKPGTLRTLVPGEDAEYNGKTVKTKAVKDEDGKVIQEAVYYTEEEMREFWANGNSGMLLWARGGEISVHNGILDGSNLIGNKNGLVVYAGTMSVTDEETKEKTTFYGKINIYGGTVMCGYTQNTGNVFANAGCELNMYGGEIIGGRANDGGNVYVPAKSVFNMYGGTISDGLVDRTQEEVDGGHGGNVYVVGTMNMYGGTIENGEVYGGKKGGGHGGNIYVAGTLNAEGGLITAGWAKGVGGNIATITSGSMINLAGVKVTDGSGVIGGNVAVHIRPNKGLSITNGTVLSGGEARGASSYGGGGNLGIRMSTNTKEATMDVVISNATITGGTAVHAKAANILFENVTTNKFNEDNTKQTGYELKMDISIADSTVDGDIFVKANKPEMITVTMGGKLNVGMGATTGLCLDAANPSFINLPKTLAAGSSVLVEGAGYISGKTAEDNKAFFSSTAESVEYYKERLFIGRMYCVCGASIEGNEWKHEDYHCDGTVYGWAPWTSTTAVPGIMGAADGHWYLTEDIKVTGEQMQVNAGENLVIDLNGKTVEARNNRRIYALWDAGATLDITDTSKNEEGVLVANCSSPVTNQGFIWSRTGTEFTLHRGTIDASNYLLMNALELIEGKDPLKADSYKGIKDGGAVAGAKFIMNGGTVIGGVCYQVGVDAEGNRVALDKPEDVKLWVDGPSGGAVAVTNFDMYGGTIRDGKSASVGGNVYVSGTFNMYGGEILNGSINADGDLHGDLAYGGNVYANKMYMHGGKIAGGQAYTANGGGNGGNIFVGNLFEGYGGTIEDGKATSNGNIGTNASSSFILLDGTDLYRGEANNGGNLGVNVRSNKGITITENTTISGGRAIKGSGGNIYFKCNENYGGNKTLTVTINGQIVDGYASSTGGNIFIYIEKSFVKKDGEVTTESNKDTVTLIMDGAQVSGGTANGGNGGNLYFYSLLGGATISNSTFENGSTPVTGERYGGNLWINGTNTVISNTTVSGGASQYGGNIYASNACTVTMNNVTVENGSATKGGNIYVNSATLTTTDTTVTGGTALTHGGNIHVAKAGTVNLNAGTVVSDGVVEDVGKTTTVRGGNILAYGKLNLDGATVYGGRATATYGASDAGRYGMGGNIFVGKEDSNSGTKPGVATIHNSQIYGGLAESIKNNGKNEGFRPGSNLYANDGATLTLDKGTVVTVDKVNGVTPDNSLYTTGVSTVLNLKDVTFNAKVNSENVLIENAVVTIEGATLNAIEGAKNLCTNDSGTHAAKLTMESGTINGGLVQICDKDLFTLNGGTINAKVTFSKTGALKLTGGTVNGGIDMISTATLTLAGAPNVTEVGGGVNLNGNIMTVEGKLTGGKVYTSDRGYITGTTESGNEAYFASVNGYGVTMHDSKVLIGKASCLCATPDNHTPGCIAAMKRILGDAYTAEAKLALLPAESAEEVTTPGYWYLPKDLELESARTYVSVPTDETIVIDLNGNTVHFKNQNGRMFTDVGGNVKNFTLVITDTTSNEVANQKGTFKLSTGASGSKDQGGLYWMTSKETNLNNQAYVLGGHLDASDFTLTANGGGLFWIDNKEAHVYMYNGELIGAKANPTNGVVRGGSVYVYKAGTFEMFDGIIRDGHASSKDTNGVWGGNICMFDTDANFIMRGGLITDGVVERTSTSTAGMNGANVYARNGTFEMYGGQIDGGVLINTDKAKITGNSIIDKGDKDVAYSLMINSGKKVNVSGLTGKLVVSGSGVIGTNANTDIEKLVISEQEGKTVKLYGTDLHMGLDYCMCGYTKSGTARTAHAEWCDKENRTWIALPDANLTVDGNFYVNATMTLGGQRAIKNNAKVSIDLNGKTLNGKDDARSFSIGSSTVNFTDSSANDENVGKGVLAGGGHSDQAGSLLIGDSAEGAKITVNIYSGTYTLKEGKQAGSSAGVMSISTNSTVNLYGGTVTGGVSKSHGGNIAVVNSASFNMYGGTVSNGTAQEASGGNIRIVSGTATFKGGSIIGGTCSYNGGNLYFDVPVEVFENMTVSGGNAGQNGGNILANSTLKITDCTIFDGVAGLAAGNLYVKGAATVSGCTIYNGASELDGGNIYFVASGNKIENCTIYDGTSQSDGGNIYAAGSLELVDSEIYGGDANPKLVETGGSDTSRGGNVYFGGDSTITGCTINGGTTYAAGGGNLGGNIYYSKKLEVKNSEIYDGTSGTGGNIGSNNSNAALSLINTKVYDGTAEKGGNIGQNVRCGKSITIDAASVIENGTATSGNGGNIGLFNRDSQNSGKSMTISIAGTVKNGSATGVGDDIYLLNPVAASGKTQDTLNVTISGKVIPAETSNGSIYIEGADTMALSGEVADIQVKRTNATVSGKIDGGITFGDTASTIALTGAPKITAKGGGVNLNGNVMTVEAALGAEAEIYTSSTGFVTGTTVAGNEKYFHSTKASETFEVDVNLYDNKIFIGKIGCLCAMPEGKHTQGCIDAMAALGMDAEAGDKLAMKPVEDTEELVKSGSGYWYLPGNITTTDLSSHISVGNNKILVLDMNGYTWDVARGSRIFTTQNSKNDGNALLILADTSEKETGKIALRCNSLSSNQGGIVWIAGNGAKANSAYLVSGTLDVSGYTFTSNDGAAVCVSSNSLNSFYMYGGTIIGAGESLEGWNSSDGGKAAAAANGGTVGVSYGSFYMYDGVIKGGHAGIKNPEYTAAGATDGKGGNVIVSGSGKFVMMGGLITEGVASVGGNVAITSETGTFEMSGGEITGGVYVNSNNVKITNDATISKGGLYSLKIEKGRVIDVEGLTGKLYVTAEVGEVFAKNAVLDHQTKNIVESEVVKSGAKVNVTYLSDNTLYMGVPSMTYCVCGTDDHAAYGCDGTKYAWVLWDKNNVLPTESGNYQLAIDIETLAEVPTPEAGAVIRLNLNGHTINLKDKQNLYNYQDNVKATVIVTDTSKNAEGKIVLTGNDTENGGFFLLRRQNTFELYRATLDASGFKTKENGAVAGVRVGGVFTMHSGKVIGGEVGSYNTETNVRSGKGGGCFWVPGGTLNIHGGEVVGGTAWSTGGVIQVGTWSATEPTGGGTVNITGGEIYGGKAWDGGGTIIRANAGSTVNMSGGHIYGGQKAVQGKDSNGKDDGKWTGAWSDNTNAVFVQGGTVTIDGKATPTPTVMNLTGGKIDGTLYIQNNGADSTLNLSGNPIVKNLTKNPAAFININGEMLAGADVSLGGSNGFMTSASEYTKAALENGYITTGVAGQTLVYVDADAIAENPHVFTEADLNKIYSVATANYYCECGGKAVGMKDHTCKNVIWKEWTTADAMPTADGNYKLTKPVNLATQWQPSAITTARIDLNGNDVTCISRFIRMTYNDAMYIAVTDSHVATTEKPIGKVISNSADGQGGTIWMTKGTAVIYDGVYENAVTNKNGAGGGVIYVRSANLNMYGGTIQNGHTSAAGGGNVVLVTPSESDTRKTTVFNMYGGTIQDGFAGDPNGAEKTGGNVYISAGTTFNMYGGQMIGGYTTSSSKPMDPPSWGRTAAGIDCRGELNISNATVNSSIELVNGSVVKISGDAIIGGDKGRGISRSNNPNGSITFKDLGENAAIKIYFTDSMYNAFNDKNAAYAISEGLTDADAAKFILSTASTYKVEVKDNGIYMVKK